MGNVRSSPRFVVRVDCTVEVRVWTPPSKVASGEYARDAALNIMKYYETFFGVKYPLPKQDLIAIPEYHLSLFLVCHVAPLIVILIT